MIYVPPLMPTQAWRFPIGDSHTITTHFLDGVLLSPIVPRGSTTIASIAPTLVPQARVGRLSPAISTRSAMPSLIEDESSYSPDYLSENQDYGNSQLADALSDSAAAHALRSQPNPATRLHLERQELNFRTLANETRAHLTAADFRTQRFMETILQRLDDSMLGMTQLASRIPATATATPSVTTSHTQPVATSHPNYAPPMQPSPHTMFSTSPHGDITMVSSLDTTSTGTSRLGTLNNS